MRQHPADEGSSVQCWHISTPCGHRATRFPYLTRPDAEAAAARVADALPGGVWPHDADTTALLPLALEASEQPALLPLTHRGKPTWGSGYGGDLADFWIPDTRDEYERMIAVHGPIPKNCQACARTVRAQKKAGWGLRTNHWPVWSVHGRSGADRYVRPHCPCTVCMRIDVRIGAVKPITDEHGATFTGSCAVYPWTEMRSVVETVEREDRPFAWFKHFLSDAGCVVIDERSGVGLWPTGVRHDDALFCETGETGALDLDGITHGS
ncbi:hypothetical protein ACIPSA_46215 [Streptomyces sp. NPDC086549]|uniref:hypothetical protein n=1 Tax=Streptomyces sp. NPDC086549 TaxID=3365752 RepID=UPI00381B4313